MLASCLIIKQLPIVKSKCFSKAISSGLCLDSCRVKETEQQLAFSMIQKTKSSRQDSFYIHLLKFNCAVLH